jgi:hypothetical protein
VTRLSADAPEGRRSHAARNAALGLVASASKPIGHSRRLGLASASAASFVDHLVGKIRYPQADGAQVLAPAVHFSYMRAAAPEVPRRYSYGGVTYAFLYRLR